jgi:hypothetical protein
MHLRFEKKFGRERAQACLDLEFDIVSDKYGILAHPDFIARKDGKLLVYEIKTTKLDTYKEIINDKMSSATKVMMADHRAQGISYIKLLKELGHEVHDRLLLVYVAKDASVGITPYHIIHCIPTDIEYNTLQDIFDRAKATLAYKDNKQLPQRLCASREVGQGYKCKLIEHCFRLPNNIEEITDES